jgi:hypothetical protein
MIAPESIVARSPDVANGQLSHRRGSVTGTVPGDYPAYVRLLHPVVDEDDVHAWEVAAEFGTRTHPLVQ